MAQKRLPIRDHGNRRRKHSHGRKRQGNGKRNIIEQVDVLCSRGFLKPNRLVLKENAR